MFRTINHGWAIEVALSWDAPKSETVTVTEHLSYEDAEALAIGRLWQRYSSDILGQLATYQAAYGGDYDYRITFQRETKTRAEPSAQSKKRPSFSDAST